MIASALIFASCSDWDDHYNVTNVGSDVTLWEQIQQRPELSDFAEVLQNTMVFRQHKKTTVSYADYLEGGQSLTLFAPVNGTFNKDSLIEVAQTASGDSAVERFFIFNHLSQKLISTNGTEQRIRLLNDKYMKFSDTGVGSAPFKESNIHSKNGILHIMSAKMPYQYTVYELLANDSRFKSNGTFLASYNEDEFDENSSISSGIVDGKKVYVDSVFISRNKLMEAIGLLNAEDSTYYVAVPTEEGWQKAWQKALNSFVFPESNPKADSLQKYWAYRALMDDAVFSKTIQSSMQDSVKSKFYSTSTPEYHVFYKPFASDGIFGRGEKIDCSNGYVYASSEWPYESTMTYHKKIEVEGESTWLATTYNKCTMTSYSVLGDSISKGAYVHIKPTSGNANWDVTYKINSTISGTYDVKVILLPKIVSGTENKRPCKFNATINYYDLEGKLQAYECKEGPSYSSSLKSIVSRPFNVDTITVARFHFPTCNYGESSNQASLTLTCNIKSTENMKYDRNMFLDAIVLVPVKEE